MNKFKKKIDQLPAMKDEKHHKKHEIIQGFN